MQKTFLPSVAELEKTRKWHKIDASQNSLGRIASETAKLLMGKHKKIFTPHLDCGDFVIIVNAENLKLTGKKMETKHYFRHSGYAGGGKEISIKQQLEKDPTKVIHLAVKRMLDDNKLRDRRMKRLKVFCGEKHSFEDRLK